MYSQATVRRMDGGVAPQGSILARNLMAPHMLQGLPIGKCLVATYPHDSETLQTLPISIFQKFTVLLSVLNS